MSCDDYRDPLYQESIPQRTSPPAGPLDGPTARWMAEHPDEPFDANVLPFEATA